MNAVKLPETPRTDADPARALACVALALDCPAAQCDPGFRGRGASVFLDSVLALGCTPADLLAAHRAGLVVLSRIDLVGAYPEDRVQASRIAYMNASFERVSLD